MEDLIITDTTTPRADKALENNIIKNVIKESTDETASGLLYEDAIFTATSTSLFSNLDVIPVYADVEDIVEWLRPNEMSNNPDYFKATSGCGTIREGALDDAWWLGAIAAIAVHPHGLLENLFVSEVHDFKTYGVYTCRFYKDAEWVEVVTDTRLPCTKSVADTRSTHVVGRLFYKIFYPLKNLKRIKLDVRRLNGCQ